MTVYGALRIAHILAWVLTLALLLLSELLVWLTARASTVEQLHARYRWVRRAQMLTNPLTIIGVLAGVGLIGVGGWQPIAPWLVVSYGLIAMMIVVGSIGQDPWQRRLDQMMHEPEAPVSLVRLQTLLRERRALFARLLVLALLLGVILVMNQKPSFGF